MYFFYCGKKYCKYKKGLGKPIRPSVAHSYKHLILHMYVCMYV
jgi:hypothetical protein